MSLIFILYLALPRYVGTRLSKMAKLSLDTLEKRRNTEAKNLNDIRDKIRAKRGKGKKKTNPIRWEVREMADEYEDALRAYKGPTVDIYHIYPDRIAEGSVHYKTLERAVLFAKELDVDFKTYIKALFYIHDKWWNKAPSTREVADYKTKVPAKERVARYLAELTSGEAKKEVKVVGAVKKVIIPQSVKSRNSELQMKSFMKNHGMSEEEVLTTFAKGTDAFLYFDAEWLRLNETYVRLRREGKI